MVAQGYKEVPRTIRTNWTALCFFDIANDKEREVIYEENTGGLARDVWDKAYRYCTSGKYDFMYINSKMEKGERIWRNFEEMITFKLDEDEADGDINPPPPAYEPPKKKQKI